MSTSAAAKFVGSSSEIAHYYGFKSLPEVAPEAKMRALTLSETAAAIVSKLTDNVDPVLTFYAACARPAARSPIADMDSGEFALQIFNARGPMSEIHMLKTLETIVIENGGSIMRLRVNSVGDRDSRQRFARELSNFLRRRASEIEPLLTPTQRTKITENPIAIYDTGNEAIAEILTEGPRPVHFLSEKSRLHFRQVLELLEQVGFPYEIDDCLIGDQHEPRVIFRLELTTDQTIVIGCGGGRYDDYLQQTLGKTYSCVHASVMFKTKTATVPSAKMRREQPKVYFVQFGDSAKLNGFAVLETLRQAHIPVSQQFDAHHLGPQLISARELGVPYVLIMGAREALDQTIIIRTLATSAQTTVSIRELPKHLRALKFA